MLHSGNIANAITIGTPTGVLEVNNLGRNVGPTDPADPVQVAAWTLNAAGSNGVNGERLAFSQSRRLC